MSRFFPLIRLRASGSTSICPSPSGPGGPVAVFSPCVGGLSTGGSSCPVMSSLEKSPSCSSRSHKSLTCSVTCSCAASSSSRNGHTWDLAHLTAEPRNVLLMTTPGCQKAFVGFLAAFAPRRQNQRGCPTYSSPL